jgi:hypothetical protein
VTLPDWPLRPLTSPNAHMAAYTRLSSVQRARTAPLPSRMCVALCSEPLEPVVSPGSSARCLQSLTVADMRCVADICAQRERACTRHPGAACLRAAGHQLRRSATVAAYVHKAISKDDPPLQLKGLVVLGRDGQAATEQQLPSVETLSPAGPAGAQGGGAARLQLEYAVLRGDTLQPWKPVLGAAFPKTSSDASSS